MGSEIPEATGPACDICAQYVAIASLMNLADYQQTRFCANCAPEFLRSMAGIFAGDEPPAADGPEPEPQSAVGEVPGGAPDQECALCHALVPVASLQAHVDDHISAGDIKADPAPGEQPESEFPGTARVVRSTHGNRKPRGRSGQPEPETES